ncbi:hypothetical protein BDZ94DRAFT_1251484 [Collybia nuda]|uniref:F-box domain-containing protein n=1 Tax=Collybia nuda TaxID=64659 RepID=A0A9P5YD20_9AGAR|nr:hypothetical protein BDZ94DRAFT_1251484 [Collybia nuda]
MLRSSDHANGFKIAGEGPGNPNYLTNNDDDEVLDPERSRKLSQPGDAHNVWHRIKRIHGGRGTLEGLIGMPLDVLFEIFGHLNPLDVLYLARTTKPLRDVLMRRSAMSVWKRALANVNGLPECPSDLAEPQWASLVFDTLCHYCWKTNTTNIVWMNRTRCCKKCSAEYFSDSLQYSDLPRELVPTSTINTGTWLRQQYCLRTASIYNDEFAKLSGQEKEAWCAAKRTEMQTRRKHAELCEAWNQSRTAELEANRKRRYIRIKLKLIELGWGDEIKKMKSNKLTHHKLVRQNKELTECSWADIRPTLIALMEEIKAERLTVERRNAQTCRQQILSRIYEEFVASQPLHSIIPGLADFVMINKFKTIIEDTPVEEEVTPEHFQGAMSELASLIDGWRQTKNRELLEMMKVSLDIGSDAPQSMLNLATTFFYCTSCKAEVQHPRILIHACTTSLRYSEDASSKYFYDLGCEPWNFGGKRVLFHHVAYTTSRSILKSCGYNPDIVTAQEIQDANPFIECLDCSNEKQGRLIMRWPQAVSHSISHQRCEGGCGQKGSDAHMPEMRLASLDEEDTELAVKLEEASRTSTSNYAALWSCVRCKKKTNLNNLRNHIRLTKNQVTEPEEAKDYVRHLDAPGHPQPVRIKPRSSLPVYCDPATCDGSACGDNIRCDPPTPSCNGDCDCDSGNEGSSCRETSNCNDSHKDGGAGCDDDVCSGNKCCGSHNSSNGECSRESCGNDLTW